MASVAQYTALVAAGRDALLDKYTFVLQSPTLPETATRFMCTECLQELPAARAAYMYGKRRVCRSCVARGVARLEAHGASAWDVDKTVTVYDAPPAYFARAPGAPTARRAECGKSHC
uniref:Uncharacterized protein n=1 Tax=viral metagenome TaxID=1070528 RepID=A0A6C0ASQ1_9ZZZZ